MIDDPAARLNQGRPGTCPACGGFFRAPLVDSFTMYYVSVIDGPRIDGEIKIKRFGLLAGPFETHDEALDKVDAVRRIAEQVNAWAHFYAFGTVKLKEPIDGGYPPGRLNHLLPEDADQM